MMIEKNDDLGLCWMVISFYSFNVDEIGSECVECYFLIVVINFESLLIKFKLV